MIGMEILAACFLRDLGWSEDESAKALASNWSFAQAVREGGHSTE